MAACDECWNRAFVIARTTGRHQAEVYRELVAANPEHPGDAPDGYEMYGPDDRLPTGDKCLCWVGHGGCGGCSGYPGIRHEPACGWEWDPDCPVHLPEPPEQVGAWTR